MYMSAAHCLPYGSRSLGFRQMINAIDAFLSRAHRYGSAANIQTVSELFDKAAQDLFKKLVPRPLLEQYLTGRKESRSSSPPTGTPVSAPGVVFLILNCYSLIIVSLSICSCCFMFNN